MFIGIGILNNCSYHLYIHLGHQYRHIRGLTPFWDQHCLAIWPPMLSFLILCHLSIEKLER